MSNLESIVDDIKDEELLGRAVRECRRGELRELFAAVTKHDLAGAVSHLRHFGSVPQMEHREKYADLIEAQAKLIAYFVNRAPLHQSAGNVDETAQGYADSLRQQADWIEEAREGRVPIHQRIDLGDIDLDELRAAADFIEHMRSEPQTVEVTVSTARRHYP